MKPPKIQYISSIAVFQSKFYSSDYSDHALTTASLGCELPAPVPEVPMDPSSAMGTGYGESKWIGEYMLLRVAEKTDVPVQIVRLAQICGDQDGYWNEEEWFPCMVKSAFFTKCLPDIHGVRYSFSAVVYALNNEHLGCRLHPELSCRPRAH